MQCKRRKIKRIITTVRREVVYRHVK